MTEDYKKSWISEGTINHINAGSLQRIASAVESMAVYHVKILQDRDYYEKHFVSYVKKTTVSAT